MSELPTPPRRRWFQFGLGAMLVVVTAIGVGIAAFGKWLIPVAALAVVEAGLVAAAIVLIRVSGRLDQDGRLFTGLAVAIAVTAPLALAVFILGAVLFLVAQFSPRY
jgi:hypothetical protein